MTDWVRKISAHLFPGRFHEENIKIFFQASGTVVSERLEQNTVEVAATLESPNAIYQL